ncbi:MAG: ASCH domain-containing protein [Planctomycetes bacterium]|jgi:hypothetical protein|nr:ASCH domain-containing protein [Planctomycetota bacterium]
MRALSIWQPWAWLIIHGGKDIENRSWPTYYRGPLLIHASKKPPRSQDLDAIALWMRERGLDQAAEAMLRVGQWDFGGIIGKVDLVDCVRGHRSVWAEQDSETWHFVLANPMELPFEAMRGERGVFEVNAGPEIVNGTPSGMNTRAQESNTCGRCHWCEVKMLTIDQQGLASELCCAADPPDAKRRWTHPVVAASQRACPRFARKETP